MPSRLQDRSHERLLEQSVSGMILMTGGRRTSHNGDLACEVEGLHDMLVWGLCEDHVVVFAVAREVIV